MLLSLIALLGAGYFLVENIGIVLTYNRVQAQILGVKTLPSRAGDASRSYMPTVRYGTSEGRIITAQTSYGSSMFNFSRGEKVTVYYDPADPGVFKIGSFMSMWLGPITGFGLGLLIFWSARRLKKDSA